MHPIGNEPWRTSPNIVFANHDIIQTVKPCAIAFATTVIGDNGRITDSRIIIAVIHIPLNSAIAMFEIHYECIVDIPSRICIEAITDE